MLQEKNKALHKAEGQKIREIYVSTKDTYKEISEILGKITNSEDFLDMNHEKYKNIIREILSIILSFEIINFDLFKLSPLLYKWDLHHRSGFREIIKHLRPYKGGQSICADLFDHYHNVMNRLIDVFPLVMGINHDAVNYNTDINDGRFDELLEKELKGFRDSLQHKTKYDPEVNEKPGTVDIDSMIKNFGQNLDKCFVPEKYEHKLSSFLNIGDRKAGMDVYQRRGLFGAVCNRIKSLEELKNEVQRLKITTMDSVSSHYPTDSIINSSFYSGLSQCHNRVKIINRKVMDSRKDIKECMDNLYRADLRIEYLGNEFRQTIENVEKFRSELKEKISVFDVDINNIRQEYQVYSDTLLLKGSNPFERSEEGLASLIGIFNKEDFKDLYIEREKLSVRIYDLSSSAEKMLKHNKSKFNVCIMRALPSSKKKIYEEEVELLRSLNSSIKDHYERFKKYREYSDDIKIISEKLEAESQKNFTLLTVLKNEYDKILTGSPQHISTIKSEFDSKYQVYIGEEKELNESIYEIQRDLVDKEEEYFQLHHQERFLSSRKSYSEEDEMRILCPLCKENDREYFYLSCCHCVCKSCFNEHECPVCQKPVAQDEPPIKMYYS